MVRTVCLAIRSFRRQRSKTLQSRLLGIRPLNPNSAYLNGYHVYDGFATDPSFKPTGRLFRLNWKYLENEVWLDSTAGWVAVVDGATHYAMVEKTKYFAGANYPGKATVIFYKNGPSVRLNADGMPHLTSSSLEETPYYMEAELNSPMAVLTPGQTYTMDSQWFPTRQSRPDRHRHRRWLDRKAADCSQDRRKD